MLCELLANLRIYEFWFFPYNLLKFRKILITELQIFGLPPIVFFSFSSPTVELAPTIVEFWTTIAKIHPNFENKTVIAKMRRCLTKFSWIFEFGTVQRGVNLVDLVKSFQTSIYYLLANVGFDTDNNEIDILAHPDKA